MIFTIHCFDKAKDRLSFSKSAAKRMSEKAFNNGVSYEDTTGCLKDYIKNKIHQDNRIIKVYGEFCYVFCRDEDEIVFITIYKLPKKISKVALKIAHQGEI